MFHIDIYLIYRNMVTDVDIDIDLIIGLLGGLVSFKTSWK